MSAIGTGEFPNADRVAGALMSPGLSAADILQCRNPLAIGLAPMAPHWLIAYDIDEVRIAQMRDARLEDVEALGQGKQSVTPENQDNGLYSFDQDR